MLIRVRFFGDLKEQVGKSCATLEIPVESSVRDFILELAKNTNPNLAEKCIDEKGKINSEITMLVNGRNIVHLNGLRTELKDHDLVALLPVVGGG